MPLSMKAPASFFLLGLQRRLKKHDPFFFVRKGKMMRKEALLQSRTHIS